MSKVEVIPVIARFVVVAVPLTVKPPAAVPLPIVVEASERRPFENVSVVEVELLTNGYPIVFVTVTAPVEPESEMPLPAVRLVTKLVEVAIA